MINKWRVNCFNGVYGERTLINVTVNCVLYGLVVVGINNILYKYILHVYTRYVGTYLGEYHLA